jgi:hypothetical protein
MDVYWHIDRRDCNEWCTEEGCYISRLAASEERIKALEEITDNCCNHTDCAKRIEELKSKLRVAVDKARALGESFKGCKRFKNSDGVCCACSDSFFEFLSQLTSNGTTGEKINNEYRGSSEEPPL